MSKLLKISASPAFWPLAFITLAFVANGAILPYMPVWYERVRGLNGEQIGMVLSLALVARIVTGPIISAWAEGLPDPRWGYGALALSVTLAFVGAALAPNYWTLLCAAFVAQTCWSALIPYAEASIFIATRAGRISYGMARAIGSAAFILASLAVGGLLTPMGPWIIWWWVVGAISVTMVSTVRMPAPVKSDEAADEKYGFRARIKSMRDLLRMPLFARLVLGAAFIQAGHAFFYNFGSLTWLKQGLSSGQVGLLWAIGVAAEIAMLTGSARLFRRFRPETLLILAGLSGIVRWSVLALAPPFAMIALMQVFHAGTFALSHASAMKLIDRMAGDRMPVAQSLYFSLGGGLLMGLATLGCGPLYQTFGAGGFFAMSVMCAIGAALAASTFMGARPRPPKPLPSSLPRAPNS